MLIAHMADTHLGLRQYGLTWREEDFYERFNEAIELAVKEGVDAIVISGDMFDKAKPPNQALKAVIQALNFPKSKGIPVYAILGEHDLPKTRDIPPQFIIPGLRVLGTSTTPYYDRLNIDGKEWWIAGISHRPPTKKGLQNLWSKIDEVSKKVSKNSILMMHQSLINIFSLEPGVDLNKLPRVFKYVAMGHIHKRWFAKEPIAIAYPGSLEIVKADEIEEWRSKGKGFYLVDLTSDLPEISPVDVEVTPQLIVKSKYPNHKRDVFLAFQKIPEGKKAILHVKVCIPPAVKAQPAAEVLEMLRKIDGEGRVYARVSAEPCIPEDLSSSVGHHKVESFIREEEVIAKLLSGGNEVSSEALRIAKLVVQLKNEVSEGGGFDSVSPLIEQLLTNELFWKERIKLSSPLEVESALTPIDKGKARPESSVEQSSSKASKTGHEGLEKFLKRDDL